MIRIIAGKLKGKRVIAPKNFNVRPTTDFAKEGFFSIINHQYNISQISVLNLFAGIGSIDYEFASRGCKDITSVEIESKHVKFIIETIKNLDIQSYINVVRQDVFALISKASKKTYDIVFADPPFDFEENEYLKVIDTILKNNYVSEEGQFVLEHNTRKSFREHPNFIETRKYGNISFTFFAPQPIGNE